MAAKREKSELERYVDGLVWTERIQAAKRPEEWARWGAVAAIVLVPTGNYVAMGGVIVASWGLQSWLTKRRLGVRDYRSGLARIIEEGTPKWVQRELRKGRFDAKVGPEARALLEACAALANGIIASMVESNMLSGGGKTALLTFKPFAESAESLMRSAIGRVQKATMLRQLPDDETLEELRATEARLAIVHEEAKRLAKEFRPPSALEANPSLGLEIIEARRELEQGG